MYTKRVWRAMGALGSRGTDITNEELESVIMRNRYVWDAPRASEGPARLDFFRARLAEVMSARREPGGNTRDSRDRVAALIALSRGLEPREAGGSRPAGFNLDPGVQDAGPWSHAEAGGGVGAGARGPGPPPPPPPPEPPAEEQEPDQPPGLGNGAGAGAAAPPPPPPPLGGGPPEASRDSAEGGFERIAGYLATLAAGRRTSPSERERQGGVIKVSPVIRWPELGDNNCDIDGFFDEFHSMTGLVNDGRGMKIYEKLLTLGQCLKGGKNAIYTNLLKIARRTGQEKSNPQKVYDDVVARLNEFRESNLERQRRVQGHFESIRKNRSSALEFLIVFEAAADELDTVGLHRCERELLLSYLDKVGDKARIDAMRDRRDYNDGAGIRNVTSWREAHKILMALEELEDGGRAFHAAFSTTAQDGSQKGRGKGKGKDKGRERGHLVAPVLPTGAAFPLGVCWLMRDRGECNRPTCHFDHDPKRVAAARLDAAKEKGGKGGGKTNGKFAPTQVAAFQRDAPRESRTAGWGQQDRGPGPRDGWQSRPAAGRGWGSWPNGNAPRGGGDRSQSERRGSGNGSAGRGMTPRGPGGRFQGRGRSESPGWGRGRSRERSQGSQGSARDTSSLPCHRFIRGHCDYGDNCKFSHQSPQKTYSPCQEQAGGPRGRPETEDGRSAAGDSQPPRRSSQKAASSYGGSQAGGGQFQVVNEDQGGPGRPWGRSDPAVFGPVWERSTKAEGLVAATLPGTRQKSPARKGMRSLQELPSQVWGKVARPPPGYNYRADVAVCNLKYVALLDTGASTNAIPEEVVVAIINNAYALGMKPEDEDWPVQLERWAGSSEFVTGIARSQDLHIIGAVILPVIFTGVDERQVSQQMRFKIFANGNSSWMGLIIGGPSLEPPPLGLGLRTYGGGHYLQALGLTVRRVEEKEVKDRMDSYYPLYEGQVIGPPLEVEEPTPDLTWDEVLAEIDAVQELVDADQARAEAGAVVQDDAPESSACVVQDDRVDDEPAIGPTREEDARDEVVRGAGEDSSSRGQSSRWVLQDGVWEKSSPGTILPPDSDSTAFPGSRTPGVGTEESDRDPQGWDDMDVELPSETEFVAMIDEEGPREDAESVDDEEYEYEENHGMTPGVVRQGDGHHLIESRSSIPWPFEGLWPAGEPYSWSYEESDPNGGASLSMVWVITSTRASPTSVPTELTIVVELTTTAARTFDVLVRHSWDDSARGPNPEYQGAPWVMSPEGLLRIARAWNEAMGEGGVDLVDPPPVDNPRPRPALIFLYDNDPEEDAVIEYGLQTGYSDPCSYRNRSTEEYLLAQAVGSGADGTAVQDLGNRSVRIGTNDRGASRAGSAGVQDPVLRGGTGVPHVRCEAVQDHAHGARDRHLSRRPGSGSSNPCDRSAGLALVQGASDALLVCVSW